METRTDQSYGVVAVKKNDLGEWQYLLVEQYDKRGGSFWALPKGHPEGDEAPEVAALRELKEEVGLSTVTLEPNCQFEQHYSFKWEGVLVNKTVVYFLGYAAQGSLTPQAGEIARAGWFDFKKAQNRLTHQNTKDILVEAHNYLNAKNKINGSRDRATQ